MAAGEVVSRGGHRRLRGPRDRADRQSGPRAQCLQLAGELRRGRDLVRCRHCDVVSHLIPTPDYARRAVAATHHLRVYLPVKQLVRELLALSDTKARESPHPIAQSDTNSLPASLRLFRVRPCPDIGAYASAAPHGWAQWQSGGRGGGTVPQAGIPPPACGTVPPKISGALHRRPRNAPLLAVLSSSSTVHHVDSARVQEESPRPAQAVTTARSAGILNQASAAARGVGHG